MAPRSSPIRAIRGNLKNDAQMRPKYNAQQGQQPSAQGNTLGPWDNKICGRLKQVAPAAAQQPYPCPSVSIREPPIRTKIRANPWDPWDNKIPER